jgi:hypothetical protein
MHLFWLLDQQGRRAPLPAGGIEALASCQQATDQLAAGQLPLEILDRAFDDWCAASYIAVYAQLNYETDPEIIEMIRFESIDLPLALQAARATRAWRDGVRQKLRDEEVERTKGAKPRL